MAVADLASNQKPDTVFLSTDDSGMEVDVSQYLTDLTDGTTYWYEASSARTNITGPREISVTFEVDENTAAGTILTHGAPAGNTYMIRYDGGWQIDLYQESGAVFLSIGLPGSAPAEAVSITAQWAMRPDPLNADQFHHEIWVWRHDSDVREIYWVNGKAAPSGGARDFVVGAINTAGGDNYGDAITMCRVGAAFHSTTEAAQDWRDLPDAPSVSGDTRLELPASEASDGLGNDAEAAGPVYLSGAAALNQNEFRLMGPILNKVYPQGARFAWEPQDNTEAPKIIVDGTDYESKNATVDITPSRTATVLLPFCHWRHVPPNASHAFVRVLLSYVATNDMKLYCVTSNLKPNSPGASWQAYVTDTISTSGSNQEIDLGLLPLPVSGDQMWFYLAFSWDADPTDATITLFSWNIVSAYKEA